jgi:hypothetical protein
MALVNVGQRIGQVEARQQLLGEPMGSSSAGISLQQLLLVLDTPSIELADHLDGWTGIGSA